MAEQNNQNLQHAEQLLREGNKQEARTVLVGYVRSNPSSTRGWWMLSFALTDQKQQTECVERVLRLDPNYAPARARLEKLNGNIHTQLSIPPFAESAPQPARQDAPDPTPQKPISRPRKNTNGQVIQFAVLAVMACMAIGVIGVGAVMVIRWNSSVPAQVAPSIPPTGITPLSLPSTWTPTTTSTPVATQTLFPTSTPLVTSTVLVLPTNTIFPTNVIPKPKVGVVQGASAPDFKLTNVNTDKKVKLSDYEGKAVIIFFWATWCQYCKMEMPEMQKIYQAYEDKGLVVLAVDVGENATLARKYRDAHSLTFPILNDASHSLSSQYHVTAFPTHFFVNPSGVISSVNVGAMSYVGVNTMVRAMLNLPP